MPSLERSGRGTKYNEDDDDTRLKAGRPSMYPGRNIRHFSESWRELMATFTGTNADETITAALVSPTVTTSGGAFPSDAADTIDAGGGVDTIDSAGGTDAVDGGAGNDQVALGAADDTFTWNSGDGSDAVDGGTETDTLAFNGSAAAEVVDLSNNAGAARLFRDIDSAALSLQQIEHIEISVLGGADFITVHDLTGTAVTQVTVDLAGTLGGNAGDGQADTVTVEGTNGDDAITATLQGGDLVIDGTAAQVIVDDFETTDTVGIFALGGDDVIDASTIPTGAVGLLVDCGLGADIVFGSQGRDQVIGGDGDDVALLGAGDDEFSWRSGDDNDTIEGQDGSDTLVFNGGNVAENIEIQANGGRVRLFRDVATVTMDLNDVETIEVNPVGGIDRIVVHDLTGTDVDFVQIDLAGTLGGTSGDARVDTIIAEATDGNDTATLSVRSGDLVLDGLASQIAVEHFEASDLLLVDGAAGADTLVVEGEDAAEQLTITPNVTNVRITGVSQFMAETEGVEDIVIHGNGGDDTITAAAGLSSLVDLTIDGGGDDDTIVGGDGGDLLRGGGGADTLDGQGGADTADYGDKAVAVSVALNGSTDAIVTVGGAAEDTIRNIENVIGGSAGDTLIGDAGGNVLSGGGGNDTLKGGGGADTLDGGSGSDTADYSDVTASVAVTLNGAGGTFVTIGGFPSDLIVNVENVFAGSGNDTLTGDGLANLLAGGGGNDTLNGGNNADTLQGGAGNDTYVVDTTGDQALETDGDGTDLVQSSVSFSIAGQFVEKLTLTGSANANATGNSLANTIVGNAGNNLIDGKTNADHMEGGAGNDTYVVDNAGDKAIETDSNGTDLVQSSVSFSIAGQFVENLTLTGSGNVNATGNSLNNALAGNSGNNTLDGGSRGDDTLNGGAGADTMQGGNGSDTYVVDNAGDTVVEANVSGSDLVRSSVSFSIAGQFVERLTLTGSGNVNATGNSLDNVIAGNSGNNTLSGASGADNFWFNTALNAATNVDHVTDFAAVDTINLENAVFTSLTTTGTLSASAFVSGAGLTSAQDADDRIVYNTATGALFYDADGAGGAAAVQFAILDNHAALTNADFVVV
jgi:Ca2+-binding RTX toxin-like protein